VRAAGGVFSWRRTWHHVRARERRALFWAFFERAGGNGATTLYGGEGVADLVRRRRHSIEHIVPRGRLARWLRDAPPRVRNGACANPINLSAEDARLNTARGELPFDLDGDPVVVARRWVRQGRGTVAVGADADGEWVPPARSRGDIARTVLYMQLVYALPIPLDPRWLAWAAEDPPSVAERAFHAWTRRRWGISNPLVDDPRWVLRLAAGATAGG
jgi:endonuclease I